MGNKLRSRNRIPFDFPNGLRVGGQLLSGTTGANQVGITSISGLSASTLQGAVDAIKALGATSQTDSVAFTGIPTAPTAPAGTNTTQIATTAFITTGVNLVSVIPVLSTLTVGAFSNSTANLSCSITNTKGYNLSTVTAQFQTALQSNPTVWTNRGTAQTFTNVSTPFTVTASGLTGTTAYFARLVLSDSNSSGFSVVSTTASFTTANLSADLDSNFDIVGATYINTNVSTVNATVNNTSNSATATADLAFATSIEVAQQAGQANFSSISSLIAFKPAKLNVLPTSTVNTLVLSSVNNGLVSGNQVYTVESGVLQKRTAITVVGGTKLLNRYSNQNVNKVTTVNDITGWTTGTSLPATVYGSQAIVTNSRVYLLGGNVSGADSAVVYIAPINSDGTLGTWTTGTSLPANISYSQAIVTNSRVYLLGGQISGAASAVVYTAPINSDGTLGTWTTGTSLPATVYVSQSIVTNSRVYLLGGQISGAASAVVYTAPINSDGTLGTWTTGTSLPATVYVSQAIVTNSRVYLLGGASSAVVYTAPINSDGTLGTWTTGTSLPATVFYSQAIVTNSRVYMLGGTISGTDSAVVYTAPFADGWNGVNSALLYSANFITDTIVSETIASDTVLMTCAQRLGTGTYTQTRIGMNNQDVSTELKATLTF
jgi:hypothetical protein